MSSEGPTTVGSINATLHLNADQFEEAAHRAEQEADRLDGRDITSRAHLDVAQALANAERLNVAERRLQIAEMNLEQVQRHRGASQQELLRAQNAVSQATISYNDLNQRLSRTMRDGTEATNAHAAATDNSANASHRDAEAKKGQFSGMQAILAASPLLLAATAELAAATVGLGVAFAAEGAAGMLAIKGIKDAMQQGTAAGETYRYGLTLLKGNLDQLSQTAAVSLVDSFARSVGDINSKMPFLNQLTGEMAAQLGRIGGTLLSDVLTGLKTMMPLIQAGANELGNFVGWLGHFTSDNGFQQFVNYAVATLPQVMGFLRDVVTLAGHLIAAFAPLGPVVVGALDALVNVLNALPLPGLAAFVGIVLGIGPAFAIAKTAVALFGQTALISSMQVTVFGTAINLAVPVIGILVAALAGLTLGIAASAAGQQTATVSANEYASALERDGNVIGQYTTQLAIKKLAEDGAYDSVSKLGLGTDVLTRAVTGNADALKIIQTAIDQANNAYSNAAQNSKASGLKIQQSVKDQKAAADELGPVLNANIKAIQTQQHVNELSAAATKDSSQATFDKAIADMQGARALGVTTSAYHDATAAQDAANQKTRDTTLAMQLQNDAAGILKATLDGLNGKALSAAQAQNAFDSQLANMGTHVDKVGKQITFTTDSIGNMSAASVALRGQLNSQVAALQTVVEANGGLSNSTGAARDQMETMRQQIIENAVAHGVDRDAVTAYIDKIMQIPASVPPTKIDADTAAALTKIQEVQAALDGLHDKTLTVTTFSTVNSGDGANAPGNTTGSSRAFNYGGAVAHLASGGTHPWAIGPDTQPAMLAPGEFVVNAASTSKVGGSTMEYINRHGQLPPQGGGTGPVYLTAVFENPFTGEQVKATVRAVAQQEIGNAVREASYLRPGV